MARPAKREPEGDDASSETVTEEVVERRGPGRPRGRGRPRGSRRQVTETVVATKLPRRVPAELGNIFERLRGSTSEVELSRYDDRDDMPAFLRNVPSSTFSREWCKNLYGGGKYQAIGLDLSGRAVVKADFRIEGPPRYPVDPSQAVTSSDGDNRQLKPQDAYAAMMVNAMNLNTAMTKAVVEMLEVKEKTARPDRDPVDDFIRMNTALRSAQPANDFGSLAKNMREIAQLGAEFGSGRKTMAEAIIDSAAPLAEQLAETVKEGLQERRRARAQSEAEQRTKVVGHIPRTTGEVTETPTHTTGDQPVTAVSLQDQLRDYFLAQLPLLVRKAQLDVAGDDAGVTFYRQLYEITDLKDWPEVQSFAENRLVIQGLRRELVNASIPAAWADLFLETITKLINEPPSDDAEPAPVEEAEPPAPSKNGKGKKK